MQKTQKMVRYDPRRYQPYSDDYRERMIPRKKPWYKKPWIWIIIGIITLIFIIALSGNLKTTTEKTENQTQKTIPETTEQQLIKYIIAQQEAGLNNENITAKLIIAGFKEKDIIRALQLSDPIVQYIITETNKGTAKPEIIDNLLRQGITPE